MCSRALMLMFVPGNRSPTYADDPPSLRQAVNNYLSPSQEPSFTLAQPVQSTHERGWIARHPALFGALVGAGIGVVAGGTLGHDCHGDEFLHSRQHDDLWLAGGSWPRCPNGFHDRIGGEVTSCRPECRVPPP
jgi:hypothetical protein